MLLANTVKSAVEYLLNAALLGERWQESLETLAHAAGAHAATIMRFRNGTPIGHLSSTAWIDADDALLAGLAPPSTRQFFPDYVYRYRSGFCVDADVYADAELDRDPYYQEFLRPRGVYWHAKTRLCAQPGERVTLSLKRDFKKGPYSRQEIAVLDSIIPDLKAALRVSQSTLDAEVAGMARVLRGRGNPVFELNSSGRVLRVHADEDFGVLRVVRGCLAAEQLSEQLALERAVMSAVSGTNRSSALILSGRNGKRAVVQLIRVSGRARDVFGAAAALAVAIPLRTAPMRVLHQDVIRAFGLTEREAQVVALLADGLAIKDVAPRLGIQAQTARNHLKSVFAKMQIGRQGELIALLCRLLT